MRRLDKEEDRILRLREVREMVRLSTATIYRMVKSGRFPAQRRLTDKAAVGWRYSDIQAWIEQREPKAQGQSEQQETIWNELQEV